MWENRAALRFFVRKKITARQCAKYCLIAVVLLTIVTQNIIWTSTYQEFKNIEYVFDEPQSILDTIYRMDSTWNLSDPVDNRMGSEEESLSNLLKSLMVSTGLCRKLVQLGGYPCRRLPDGGKKICFDDNVYPGRDFCLVYSFGIGNDLSFDWAMSDFGCQVYAFDQDEIHNKYPQILDGVILGKIRLGKRKTILNTKLLDGSWFKYIYRTLDNIQNKLQHINATLDYLKIDIEGDEWDVFTESIFKTDILSHTKQLAFEFHLNDLDNRLNKTKQQRQRGINKYQSVIDGLHGNGFQLVWFEPNFFMPVTSTISNRTFHLYGETLWINSKWKKPHIAPKKYEKKILLDITRRNLKHEDIGWSWYKLSYNWPS